MQFESLDLSYIEKLSKLSYHYDRSSIRRIKPDSKRYTMLACHLHEITKSAIDEIIDANDKLLGEIERRVNRDFDKCYKKLKNNAKISRDLALRTLRGLLNHQQRESMTIKQFCDEMDDEKLSKIISDCEELEKFDHSGKAALARRRYSYLHEYIKLFLNFDFHTSQGYESLLNSI